MKKKMLSLFLVFAMVITMAAPALAAEESEGGKIVILHTNDVHCGIDQAKNEEGEVTNIGYAGVAAYKTAMETEYGAGNVTLVDAGDAIQGGPIGTLSKGAYIVEIMNQVGYDLAIPGNHEFDYGMDNFLTLAREKAEYAYLCANFTDLEGKAVLDGYQVLTYGDVKVGYVGIDTPESFTKSTPTYFQAWTAPAGGHWPRPWTLTWPVTNCLYGRGPAPGRTGLFASQSARWAFIW